MPGRQIVILTEEFDPHADFVIQALRRMGEEPLRFHPRDLPQAASMSFRLGADGEWSGELVHRPTGRRIDVRDIRSIWWRRPRPFELPKELSFQEREFASAELEHAWRGFQQVADCYWMSWPPAIRLANSKLDQLRRAVKLGFEVPRTLITMDPDAARAFYEECGGKAIFKVLTDPQLGRAQVFDATAEFTEPKTAYTTPLTEKELGMLDSVRLAPCQFQELIPKRLELRVTVIGDELFTAELHSQEDARTQVDWRHYEAPMRYTQGTLPPEVAERCLKLVRGFGLQFSAMDLILTPDGRYVFLESNPNGQFMFLEQHIPELKLADAVASRLARGARG